MCLYNKHMNKVGWWNYQMGFRTAAIQGLDGRFGCKVAALISGSNTSTGISFVWGGSENFLDDNVTIFNDPPATAVAVPHLANQVVTVIADDVVYPQVQVDELGDFVIDGPAAAKVVVGYTYVSKIRTLPKGVMASVLQNTHASLKNWSKIYVHLFRSINPLIQGVKQDDKLDDNGKPILRTGKLKQTDNGWDLDGDIEIETSEPYEMNILAIHGDMSSEEL